jgi:hypothetical protein
MNQAELSISRLLFQASNTPLHWKVELNLVIAKSGANSSANASMIYSINKPPQNGTCSIDKLIGYAAQTFFNIKCVNWTDPEGGTVVKYEYFGKPTN